MIERPDAAPRPLKRSTDPFLVSNIVSKTRISLPLNTPAPQLDTCSFRFLEPTSRNVAPLPLILYNRDFRVKLGHFNLTSTHDVKLMIHQFCQPKTRTGTLIFPNRV